LPEKLFGNPKAVVFFLDDFIGTGKQVCGVWTETISQVVFEYQPMYLAVVAALREGITRVEAETPLKIIPVHTLGGRY
jgi:hypothetical protein